MPMVTQSRTLPSKFPGHYVHRNKNGLVVEGDKGATASQVTTSFRDGKDKVKEVIDTSTTRNGFTTFDPKYDNGHEFTSYKVFDTTSHEEVKLEDETTGEYYTGALTPYPSEGFTSGFIPIMDQNEVNRVGTEFIKQTRPLKSEASLATLVGELKSDGLPSLSILNWQNLWNPKRHTKYENGRKVASTVGSDYLATQFGYMPIASDVQKLMQSVINVSDTLKQMDRDSGKVIRRKRALTLPGSIEQVGSRFGGNDIYNGSQGRSNMIPNAASALLSGSGSVGEITRYTSSSYRFSAAYSYYWPEAVTAVDKLVEFERRANVVLGSRLTPEVLWELAPWSWLADWFGNVGDIISNATALSSDNLVMRYGYLTKRTTLVQSYSCPYVRSFNRRLGTVTYRRNSTRLERRRATPYGFGVNLDGLSPAKWLILGALGMTLSPRTLRLVS